MPSMLFGRAQLAGGIRMAVHVRLLTPITTAGFRRHADLAAFETPDLRISLAASRTSTWRSFATISWGLCFYWGIPTSSLRLN